MARVGQAFPQLSALLSRMRAEEEEAATKRARLQQPRGEWGQEAPLVSNEGRNMAQSLMATTSTVDVGAARAENGMNGSAAAQNSSKSPPGELSDGGAARAALPPHLDRFSHELQQLSRHSHLEVRGPPSL